jgi:hypothetical protein
MGITLGSFLVTLPFMEGLLGLFVLSGLLRMAALVFLVFVQEQRSVPVVQLMRVLFPIRQPTNLIEVKE